MVFYNTSFTITIVKCLYDLLQTIHKNEKGAATQKRWFCLSNQLSIPYPSGYLLFRSLDKCYNSISKHFQ
jgi:hypothetical protein